MIESCLYQLFLWTFIAIKILLQRWNLHELRTQIGQIWAPQWCSISTQSRVLNQFHLNKHRFETLRKSEMAMDMVEGDPGSCCSSDFSLVGRTARSRSLPQVEIFTEALILLWSFDIFCHNENLQDDFCRLVGDSGCLGWDSGVGSDCFPVDPDQGTNTVAKCIPVLKNIGRC